MKKTITIAARKKDPQAYGVQKYANDKLWNIPGRLAPNGVSATKYLRDTAPDVSALSPLAGWIVNNAPKFCAGRQVHSQRENRVVCYNGRTVVEQLMYEAKTLTGRYACSNPEGATRHAQAVVEGYYAGNDGNAPQQIEDWLFDIIEPSQTDENYWNLQAEKMLAAGTVRITIGDAEWYVQGEQ